MKFNSKLLCFTSGCLATIIAANMATPALAALQPKTIEVLTGVNIYVDDAAFQPKDANGNTVEAFVYNGTTYLPARAISNAVNTPIEWDGTTQSVFIGKHAGNATYLVDICRPYQVSNGYSAYYAAPNTMTMAGEKYTKGFSMYTMYSGYAYFNLNGAYDTLEFDFGHIDGSDMQNSTCYIYLDGKLADTIHLESGSLVQHHVVKLNGALQMRITWNSTVGYPQSSYGFANITVS